MKAAANYGFIAEMNQHDVEAFIASLPTAPGKDAATEAANELTLAIATHRLVSLRIAVLQAAA